jgi:hypothetical protein
VSKLRRCDAGKPVKPIQWSCSEVSPGQLERSLSASSWSPWYYKCAKSGVARNKIKGTGKRSGKPVMGFADRLRILATHRDFFGPNMTPRVRYAAESTLKVSPTKLQKLRKARRCWRARQGIPELRRRTIISCSTPHIWLRACAPRPKPV